ncbi:protein of unknown function [Methanoculleus bourgensis]|uniref:Uncharacterized protein n=1 Tax=Methanoculleus bourgensis TaxID=83986 RepID=A0A0X3BMW4_9EURY|nr:protein of unknown function [Methanoculleus bourgensis]
MSRAKAGAPWTSGRVSARRREYDGFQAPYRMLEHVSRRSEEIRLGALSPAESVKNGAGLESH